MYPSAYRGIAGRNELRPYLYMRDAQACEMLKPVSRGAIHRARSRPPFVTVFAK